MSKCKTLTDISVQQACVASYLCRIGTRLKMRLQKWTLTNEVARFLKVQIVPYFGLRETNDWKVSFKTENWTNLNRNVMNMHLVYSNGYLVKNIINAKKIRAVWDIVRVNNNYYSIYINMCVSDYIFGQETIL